MKLHYNPASPYVRKVRVLAMKTGLMDDIELAKVTIAPVGPDAELCADNPIGKIPTLVRNHGGALYDSRVICEYLDGLHAGVPGFSLSRRGLAGHPAQARRLVREIRCATVNG